VSAGDALGAVGTTGSRSASEPHLHFGVREAGTRHGYRNPLDFLPPRSAPPAPEAPHPTPAPARTPTPVARVPSPVPATAPRRVPLGGRSPRPVPLGGRAPRPVPLGGRVPRGVPLGGRAPRAAPVGEREPGRVSVADPAPRSLPGRVPAAHRARSVPLGDRVPRPAPLGRAPVGGLAATPAAVGAHATSETPGNRARSGSPQLPPELAPTGEPSRRPAQHVPGAPRIERSAEGASLGPDVGWILACVGLLAAAAMLGLTEDGRNATRRGHRNLIRLLRPLTGRD
jgi:hypothetical protein